MQVDIDYRKTLESELTDRQAKGPYSIRKMAADLEVSPSFLSQVLSGKKELTEARAQSIGKKLGWEVKRIDQFVDMVRYERCNDPELKDRILGAIKAESEPKAPVEAIPEAADDKDDVPGWKTRLRNFQVNNSKLIGNLIPDAVKAPIEKTIMKTQNTPLVGPIVSAMNPLDQFAKCRVVKFKVDPKRLHEAMAMIEDFNSDLSAHFGDESMDSSENRKTYECAIYLSEV